MYIPRILTLCGHTLCEICLSEKLKESEETGGNFQCTDCGVTHEANPIYNFPKNLALLNIEKKAHDLSMRSSDQLSTSLSRQNSEKQACPFHNKKLDAFCQQCKEVLCIDCILGEHNSHDMGTIENAAELERNLFRERYKRG